MRWKSSVTLVLFLSLNHRKRSHTRARTAQCRLHVSAAESNHIRPVSKPHSAASIFIICGPRALTHDSERKFPFGKNTWLKPSAGENEWRLDVHEMHALQLHFNMAFICHHTITFTACIAMNNKIHSVKLVGILQSLYRCLWVSLMWVWIPVPMLYSSWALKPRQRRVGTSLIRAGVTAPDTQHSH